MSSGIVLSLSCYTPLCVLALINSQSELASENRKILSVCVVFLILARDGFLSVCSQRSQPACTLQRAFPMWGPLNWSSHTVKLINYSVKDTGVRAMH